MIFFFGSSRSWAAREARRKARHMAQKKRRAIFRLTVSAFSLVILSISMWSLMKMRHVQHPTKLETKSIRLERGNMSSTTIKAGETAKIPKLEMPRPPLEPLPPGLVKEANNASAVIDGKKGNAQGNDAGTARLGGSSTGETGEGSYHSSGQVEAIHRSPRTGEAGKGSSYQPRSEDQGSSSGAVTRGLMHEETGHAGGSHDDVMKQSGQRTISSSLHDATSGVQKQDAVDVLDTEEGGVGPTIILPKRKSNPSYDSKELDKTLERRQEGIRENVLAGFLQRHEHDASRKDHSPGLSHLRVTNTGEHMTRPGIVYSNEDYMKADRIASNLGMGAPAQPRMATEGHRYGFGPPGHGKMVGGGSMGEAAKRNYLISRERRDVDGLRMQTGTVGRTAVREAANENLMTSGYHSGSQYHENRAPTMKDMRNVASGNTMEHRVAGRDMETRDPSGFVTNVESRSKSNVNTRDHGTYVSPANAAGSVASGLAVRNGARAQA